MYELVDAKVQWYPRYSNAPQLQLQFKDIPNEYSYKQFNNVYISVHKCGLVQAYYYSSPGEGFGGRTFTLNMEDGTKKDLIGPWHGGGVGVTKDTGIKVVDISYCGDQKTADRGFTYYFGFCTFDTWIEAVKLAEQHEGPLQIIKDKHGFYTVNRDGILQAKENNTWVKLGEKLGITS